MLQAVFKELNLNTLGFQLDFSSKEKIIESVKFAFSQQLPEFIKEYDDLSDDPPPMQLERLCKTLYDLRRGYLRIWGIGSIMIKNTLPEFTGSHIDVLIAAFDKLPLDRYGFVYEWKNIDDCLGSLRYCFRQKIPDIMERYNNVEKLRAKQIETLRNDIYKIRRSDFDLWGISSSIKADFFGKSYINVLLALFDHPKLKLKSGGFFRKEILEKEPLIIQDYVPMDIVDEYFPLMQQLSKIYSYRMKKSDDMYFLGACMFGLRNIAKRYSPQHPAFKPLVITAMINEIKTQGFEDHAFSPYTVKIIGELSKAESRLLQKGIQFPTLTEYMEETGFSLKVIRQHLSLSKGVVLLSMLETEEQRGQMIADTLEDVVLPNVDNLQKEVADKFNEGLTLYKDVLDKDEIFVLTRLYVDSDRPSEQELAEETGDPIQWIQKCHNRAIKKLRLAVENDFEYKNVVRGCPATVFREIYRSLDLNINTLKLLREIMGISEELADRDTNRLASAGLIEKNGKGDLASIAPYKEILNAAMIDGIYNGLVHQGTRPRIAQVQEVVEREVLANKGVIQVRTHQHSDIAFTLKQSLDTSEHALQLLRQTSVRQSSQVKALILYADDILDRVVFSDFKKVFSHIAKNDLLKGGPIILYSRIKENGILLQKMIYDADASLW